MAHDDEMFHFKRRHRVFESRCRRMGIPIRRIGLHKVRNIAVQEEIALICAKDLSRVHSAV